MTIFKLLILTSLVGGVAMMLVRPDETAAADKSARVLRHIVLYKFKDTMSPAQVLEVVDAFSALPGKIDSVIGFEHGTNVSQEQKSEGFTHCFYVTFRDDAGLAAYLKHPAHDAYVQIVRDRREKVIVFDYWTAP